MIKKGNSSPESLSQISRLGFLFKDSVVYGGASAISKSIALITFPLLARHFSIIEYGVLDYFVVIAGLLSVIFVFGQDSAVARFYYERDDEKYRKQIISQALILQITLLIVFLPVIWLSVEKYSYLWLRDQGQLKYIKIVLLQVPFSLLINFSQNLLKWSYARNKFLIISMGYTLVQGVLIVIGVIIYNVNIEGVLIVNLVTNVLFGILGLIFVRKWIILPKKLYKIREMMIFAIPYGIICILSSFSPTMERMLTRNLLGENELGLYAVATKMAMIVVLVINAFQMAWGPFSLSLYKKADSEYTYNLVFKIFSMVMCLCVLFLTLMAQPFIYYFASAKYMQSIIVIFPLIMGLAIQATSWITEIGIAISKKSYLILYSYSASILSTLISIKYLVPLYGLFGVGIGVLIGHIIKAFISSWLAQKTYRLFWDYGSVISLMMITIIIGFMSMYFIKNEMWSERSVFLILGHIIVVSFGWGRLLNRAERVKVTRCVKGFIKNI